jgi:hypothetical protein
MTTCGQVAISGFPGYAIDKRGRVYSYRRYASGRRLQHRRDTGGYWYVTLRRNNKAFTRRIHCLLLEAFIGPRPPEYEGCHNDGNYDNNALDNLRWDTPAANHADKLRHGTPARGEKHGLSKLTEADVKRSAICYH